MDGPCASWTTPFEPVSDAKGIVCAPPGTTLTQCSTMTDGVNSLWYANRTLSATNTTEFGVGTFFSYTATITSVVTFEVLPYGIEFSNSITVARPVYRNGTFNSSLCLRRTFPFLALVRNGSVSWNETTNPPFYLIPDLLPAPSPTPKVFSDTSSVYNKSSIQFGTILPIFFGGLVLLVLVSVFRRRMANQDSVPQPVIQLNGQRAEEEALPAYQQSHEMENIVSPHPGSFVESNAGLSVASGRVSVAPSTAGSEILLLESWSVEEVARWVRLNGAGRAGAEKVREIQMDGGVLKQLTVEEILQAFSLEDEYEKDKLREALAVLKADNGECPPVYI
ncbi:hypothetical protein HDU81_002324 [Chytriomyces hyalinus]|nr:hypothetical protein HDU81_002324 [Chytriomyces hyalinus]